jgi:hypothetical protein
MESVGNGGVGVLKGDAEVVAMVNMGDEVKGVVTGAVEEPEADEGDADDEAGELPAAGGLSACCCC